MPIGKLILTLGTKQPTPTAGKSMSFYALRLLVLRHPTASPDTGDTQRIGTSLTTQVRYFP